MLARVSADILKLTMRFCHAFVRKITIRSSYYFYTYYNKNYTVFRKPKN